MEKTEVINKRINDIMTWQFIPRYAATGENNNNNKQ